MIPLAQGDYERAAGLFEEGLGVARRVGDRLSIRVSLHNLALARQAQGDLTGAAALLGEGATLSDEAGDDASVAYFLEGLAGLAALRGDPDQAARLFGAAEALLDAAGGVPVYASAPDRSGHDQAVAGVRSHMDGAAFEEAWAQGRAMGRARRGIRPGNRIGANKGRHSVGFGTMDRSGVGQCLVIAGAGYAGQHVALRLAAGLDGDLAIDLTLVDQHDDHQLLTELPRVAAGTRHADAVRLPVARVLERRARFVRTRVTGFDIAQRQLQTEAGPLPYTRLVLALGSRTNDFGIPGLAKRTLSLYSADDADQVGLQTSGNARP